jgi:hypothetical protein
LTQKYFLSIDAKYFSKALTQFFFHSTHLRHGIRLLSSIFKDVELQLEAQPRMRLVNSLGNRMLTAWTDIWDRCYDFKNIFAEKFGKKLCFLLKLLLVLAKS